MKSSRRRSREFALQGLYQWHVRARRAGGTIVGPWSEWRRLRVY